MGRGKPGSLGHLGWHESGHRWGVVNNLASYAPVRTSTVGGEGLPGADLTNHLELNKHRGPTLALGKPN